MQRTFPAAPCAQPSKPFQWLRRGVCPAAVLLALAVGGRASAQTVASYAFSQNTTQAYTPITGGTFVATASSSGDDLDANVYQNLPIGFTFRFAGTDYTSFTLSTNGFITLGATPPSDFDAPISSSTGYDAALAPFGADLVGNISAGNGAAGDLRYQTLGSGTAHTLVVQFSNFQPAGATSTLLNFQVRLDEAGSVVRFAYGAFPVEASFSTLAQVGLRGIYSGSSTPFNNRTTATDWTQTTPGAGRTATMTLSSTVKPPVGLEYAFTPPNSCPSPQQLNVNSITDTSAQLTFTPASPAPAGSYTLTIAPAPTGGSPQAVSASPYALTGLAAGTTYSVTLVSNCTGGVTSVPATLSFTTQASCTAPGGVAVTSVTTTTAQVSFTAGNGNTGYTATATPAAGGNGPVTVTGTASPLGITGLTPGIRYNVTVTGSCTGGATATSAPAVSFVTLAANDEPTTAQTLTVAATCTATYGATVGATTTTPNGYANPGSCGAAANPKDVWYQFTTAASGVASAGVRVAVAGTAAGTVRVFATAGGAAGPFSQVACSAGSGSNTQAPAFEATGLMPSTPYYISVAGFTSTDTQGTFSICLTTQPAAWLPRGYRLEV